MMQNNMNFTTQYVDYNAMIRQFRFKSQLGVMMSKQTQTNTIQIHIGAGVIEFNRPQADGIEFVSETNTMYTVHDRNSFKSFQRGTENKYRLFLNKKPFGEKDGIFYQVQVNCPNLDDFIERVGDLSSYTIPASEISRAPEDRIAINITNLDNETVQRLLEYALI
jgi:hypothetical protein